MAKIGFIGLGHMGHPMVLNLLKNNHEVKIFDIIPEVIESLVEKGAVAASSLKNLCKDVDVVFTMLPTGDHVKVVCTDRGGLFNHCKKGTLIIDSSSIEVDTSRYLEKIAHDKGFGMIDAPVSGGILGAQAGTLTFMVGGDEENFKAAKPILEGLGKAVIYAGAAGNGQAAKICNNMILGSAMIAVSEAFVLAEKLGLEPQVFYDISSVSSGQCWSMTNYCPVPGPVPESPANNGYKAGFTATMMLKDLYLSQTAAHSVGVKTPMGEGATHLYETYTQEGNGQMDFSGIINMISGETSKKQSEK